MVSTMNSQETQLLNSLLKEKQKFVTKALDLIKKGKNKEASFWFRLESSINQDIEKILEENA